MPGRRAALRRGAGRYTIMKKSIGGGKRRATVMHTAIAVLWRRDVLLVRRSVCRRA
jgi:hypothetical protein